MVIFKKNKIENYNTETLKFNKTNTELYIHGTLFVAQVSYPLLLY